MSGLGNILNQRKKNDLQQQGIDLAALLIRTAAEYGGDLNGALYDLQLGRKAREAGMAGAVIAAAGQAQQADDTNAEWRRLALQFDGHRMRALAHLRCLLENHESHAEAVRAFLTAPPLSGEQVLNDRIAAMYQSTDDWQPSGIEYDRSIHGNPDAGAWAKFFVETFPALKGKEGLMLGWFANAMMAMRDYLQTQPPAVPDGYALVPIEPTDDMCAAAWESEGTDYVGEHHRIVRFDIAYKAAIAAAQKGGEA